MEILKVDNIVKSFGAFKAVDGISFRLAPGKIFGLLGPNGAGKTTTLRMITNILMPDSGTIEVLGTPSSSLTQNFIGYLPEERGLYKKLKVIEQLVYFGRLKGMTISDANKAAKLWLHKLGADGWENKKIQELSKGMQQKVQFITTLLHEPELLILDEPFSGFDPVNTELLKNVILEMKAKGKTIILSTHVMEQVEQMCEDICLINKGKVVLSGKVRDAKASYGRDSVIIEFSGDDSFISRLNGITIVNRNESRLEFRLGDSGLTPREILDIAMSTADIYKFELVEPSMNEIFLDVVSRKEAKIETN